MAEFTCCTKAVEDLFASYVGKGIWRNSFLDDWERNARLYPDKEALVDSRRRMTWSQVMKSVERLALALRDLGLERDSVMAVQLPWSVDMCLLRAAHEQAGIVSAELAYTLRHRELSAILSCADAKAIVVPWLFRDFDFFQMVQEIRAELPRLRHVIVAGPDVPPGATSLDQLLEQPVEEKFPADYLTKQRHSPFEMSVLWHTTGTTGLPKLVESAPAGVEWAGRKHHGETGDKLTSDDVCGIVLPAVTGPNVLPFHSASFVGAKIVMIEHFQPEQALKLIQEEKITVTSVVPALMSMMLEVPSLKQFDLSSLRFMVCAGASLNYGLARKAEEEFGCPVVQHYGSQENGVVTIVQHPSEPQQQRLFTVGRPSVDCDVRMVDERGREVPLGEVGAIEARGPCMQGCYHKDAEATRAAWTDDGYCRMGDLGKFDENGNIVLVGRAKDVIIRGGQNIYPIEVESLLLGHPKVAQAAVVGVPDPVMGERACAFVVPKLGESFAFEEMIAYLRSHKIAAYKLPERCELRDKLPLAGDQKVDKQALRRSISRKFSN